MSEQWQASRFELSDDGIAVWTMTEPEIMNPLTPELNADFEALVARVHGNPDVKALIMAGEAGRFRPVGTSRAWCSANSMPTIPETGCSRPTNGSKVSTIWTAP